MVNSKKKRKLSLLLCGAVIASCISVPTGSVNAASGVAINSTNFPDSNFRKVLSAQFDKNSDGVLQASELSKITTLNFATNSYTYSGDNAVSDVKSIKGIEKLSSLKHVAIGDYDEILKQKTLDFSSNKNLTKISISGCNKVTEINLSGLKKLNTLETFGANSLTTITFKNNTALKNLSMYNSSKYSKIDLSKLPALENCTLCSTGIKSLDVTKNKKLKDINCTYSKLSSFKSGSSNTKLAAVYVYSNPIKSLDVSKLKNLKKVSVADTKLSGLSKLKVYKKSNITALSVRGLGLKTLKNYGYDNLTFLDCSNNKLTSVPLTSKFQTLYCYSNKLSKFDVSKGTKLKELSVANNSIKSFDVSKNSKLQYLDISNNGMTSVNFGDNSNIKNLFASDNNLKSIGTEKLTKLQYFYLSRNPFTKLTFNSDKIQYASFYDFPNLQTVDLEKCKNSEHISVLYNVAVVLPEGEYTFEYRKFGESLGRSYSYSTESRTISGRITLEDLTNNTGLVNSSPYKFTNNSTGKEMYVQFDFR